MEEEEEPHDRPDLGMKNGVSVRWATRARHELVYRIIFRDMHLNGAGFPRRDSTETSINWLNGVPVLR